MPNPELQEDDMADARPVQDQGETPVDFAARMADWANREAGRAFERGVAAGAGGGGGEAARAIQDLADTLANTFRHAAPPAPAPAPAIIPAPPAPHNNGNRKITPLTSTGAVEWQNWRAMFIMVARVMGWNDLRQRQELFINLQGEAAAAVQDIDPEDAAIDIDGLLAAYEGRFVTRGAGDLARMEFTTSKQTDDEDILSFHGRLRALYRRAYPTAPINAIVEGRMLREKFVLGLADAEIRKEVWKSQPGTFEAALTQAENHHATLEMMRMVDEGDKYQARKKGIHAVSPDKPVGGLGPLCWHCSERGHIRPDCPKKKKNFKGKGKKGGKNNNNNKKGNAPTPAKRSLPSVGAVTQGDEDENTTDAKEDSGNE